MASKRPKGDANAMEAFAKQLKAWREKMRWTQPRLASEIDRTPQLVSKIENMDARPTPDFAERLDRAFDLPGTFSDLQQLISRQAVAGYFSSVVTYEERATAISGWELGPVPGLLQTDAYARASITSRFYRSGHEEIGEYVTSRLERQKIFARPEPPEVWYVLDERVLRHVVGGPAVMAAQLDHLLAISRTPGFTIQVMQFMSDNHAGSDGPISVYDFPDDPTVCYTECSGGGRIVDEREEVVKLVTLMGRLRAAAVSIEPSRGFIEGIRDDYQRMA